MRTSRLPRLGILVPVVLAVLALAAVPGGAAAVSADVEPVSEGIATDTCRSHVADPQQPCDAVRSTTHGAAAACRRTGEADACTPLHGQRVAAEAVVAYAASPTAAAHALQRELQEDLPLRHATFVATHNSYNSYAYDPTLSGMDANQTYSLAEQLEMDARRLELDIHWWIDATTGERAPVLCHATGDPVPHTGCTAERPFAEGLAEIDAWLDANPDELLMLRIETHLDGAGGYDHAAADLDAVLGDHLFLPPSGGGCTELDLDLTRADVRAAGAQVVILSDCGEGSAWPGLVWDDGRVRVESTARGQDFAYPTCAGIPRTAPEDEVSYATRWIRFWDDATLVSSLSSTGGAPPQRGTPAMAREWTRCGVNQPSFDHLTPTDGRLEALVWTWAEGEGTTGVGESCAVLLAEVGRFGSRPCEDPSARAYLCTTSGGDLLVTAVTGEAGAHAAACLAQDATPAVPRSGYEVQQAVEAATAAGATGEVWIALAEGAAGWAATGS